MQFLEVLTLLIFFASAFTYINLKFLKLPYTIGMMIMALVMSLGIELIGLFYPHITEVAENIVKQVDFSEVLLNIMLSFLLFASALHINLQKLAEEKWPIFTLATVGVLISTVVTATAMYYLLPLIGISLDYIYCLLFGALISPTDPIAVLAMVKEYKISKNLEVKFSGESLFNDGIGVVVFLTIFEISNAGLENFQLTSALSLFGQEVIGGVGLGIMLGYAGFHFLKLIDNSQIQLEVLVTLTMVLVGTVTAQKLHVSSPLAMVVMGLFVGNEGRKKSLANVAGDYVLKFWDLVDEVLNALLFILIGLQMVVIVFPFNHFIAGLMAITVVLISRFIGVGVPLQALKLRTKIRKKTVRLLTWGGLRGGISVALALSLPPFPHKELIVTITYCVVVFSIIVQGLTIGKMFAKTQDDEQQLNNLDRAA
ncbi:MAG: sodium:proton antiporter [Cyclobacteriaceae bacterium]|nr:sodium:proton antiporter [Cyclobacteriaceae bacterium]